MSTVKEDATQIAGCFIPSVGKLVAAASLCWSNVGAAGDFDMDAAEVLVNKYSLILAEELLGAAKVIDAEVKIPSYLKRFAIQATLNQLEIDLGLIDTYLDRAINQMKMLAEDMP